MIPTNPLKYLLLANLNVSKRGEIRLENSPFTNVNLVVIACKIISHRRYIYIRTQLAIRQRQDSKDYPWNWNKSRNKGRRGRGRRED